LNRPARKKKGGDRKWGSPCGAVSAEHDINAYLNLLAMNGNLTLVGAAARPLPVSAFSLIAGNRSFSGSNIGGLPETQEMRDFCGEHNITADVEVIPIQKVNEAYERLIRSDVKYRFSIDMAILSLSLKSRVHRRDPIRNSRFESRAIGPLDCLTAGSLMNSWAKFGKKISPSNSRQIAGSRRKNSSRS
jgi:hypothetical protein